MRYFKVTPECIFSTFHPTKKVSEEDSCAIPNLKMPNAFFNKVVAKVKLFDPLKRHKKKSQKILLRKRFPMKPEPRYLD